MSNIGLMLTALSTVSGMATSISSGYVAQAEAGFNRTIAETEGKAIDIQKEIEFGQYQRFKGRTLATSVANVGASGIELSGSPLAAMITAQTQISLDQAIGQYNLAMAKGATEATAESFKRKGKAAVRYGYTSAFSELLQGAEKAYKYWR